MADQSFHVLYVEDQREWSSWRYHGIWTGADATDVVAKIRGQLPANAVRVAVFPVNGGLHFTRAGWEPATITERVPDVATAPDALRRIQGKLPPKPGSESGNL